MFLWTVLVIEVEFFTLKMKALEPSKTLVTIYQLTQ